MNFIDIIEYIGTFAFAISGLRLASAKRYDLFGAYVVGFVTAVGGGSIRDLLLGISPFWMTELSYLICTGIALLFVIIFRKYIIRLNNTFFIFDTIGLGLFVVVGFEKAIDCGQPYWIAIIMGMITGAGGGILRDVLLAQIPLIFRKEIYASACIIGGLVYTGLSICNTDETIIHILSAASVIFTPIIAVKYKIGLPRLKPTEK